LGAFFRNFISLAPVGGASGALLEKPAAVPTTPTFSATAAAINRFNDTPSSLASGRADRLTERGSFKGYVALLMVLPFGAARLGQGIAIKALACRGKVGHIVSHQRVGTAVKRLLPTTSLRIREKRESQSFDVRPSALMSVGLGVL